jgi:DNA-binding PadR family transcriptional regulator
MNHSFNVEIATKYGMLEAILLEHLNFWISKNKANEVNFYDGNYWTYNSTKALAQLFPYVSLNTISRALRHLKEEGLILVGNYNKISYDRTTWYAITEKGNSILQNDEMDSPKMENGFTQNDEMDSLKMTNGFTQNDEMDSLKMTNGFTQIDKPIPDINPDINTNINISDITPDINIPDINTDINPDDIVTVSNETVCQTDVRLVVEAWNKLQDYGINPVSKISNTSKRCHSLVARIRQYGITEVLSAIERIKLSDFLQGKNNKGWVITFDWFVLPNNFPKVLEGNYDNGQRQKTPYQSQTEQMLENSYSMMSEWAKNKKMQEGFNDN